MVLRRIRSHFARTSIQKFISVPKKTVNRVSRLFSAVKHFRTFSLPIESINSRQKCLARINLSRRSSVRIFYNNRTNISDFVRIRLPLHIVKTAIAIFPDRFCALRLNIRKTKNRMRFKNRKNAANRTNRNSLNSRSCAAHRPKAFPV